MQTEFSPAQLADPGVAVSEAALRLCVHCGFCASSCPTYALLGDELDSPRGRIYLIKDMLETEKPASESVVKHLDRCLSCLACQTICPSGVNYMHLIDHARGYVERTHARPLPERALRGLLGYVMPRPGLFRWLLKGAKLAKAILPIKTLLPGRLGGMVAFVSHGMPAKRPANGNRVIPAQEERRARVGLLAGCVQQVIGPQINAASIRLLTRLGCEVVLLADEPCCGSLTHHLGQEDVSLARMKGNIENWSREIDGEGLDAIVVNASGCGTTLKDYGFLFREDAEWADRASAVAGLTKDISEFVAGLGPLAGKGTMRVTYQSACSLQHGQKITREPVDLLRGVGFDVAEPAEPHMCCGSAGTYNLLQPEIAERLRERKVAAIDHTMPEVIATGNIGCMTQLSGGTNIPVVHTVELLDWATGGPMPDAMGPSALGPSD